MRQNQAGNNRIIHQISVYYTVWSFTHVRYNEYVAASAKGKCPFVQDHELDEYGCPEQAVSLYTYIDHVLPWSIEIDRIVYN